MKYRGEAFDALDETRWRCTRRRQQLIGGMFWGGTGLALVSTLQLVAVAIDLQRVPPWAMLALAVHAAVSMVLFHVNQRRLDSAEARWDECLRKALQHDAESRCPRSH